MTPNDPWANRSDGMRCKTCIWYAAKVAAEPAPEVGRCRRHAPIMSGFPVVYPHDWCGDHRLDENKLGGAFAPALKVGG